MRRPALFVRGGLALLLIAASTPPASAQLFAQPAPHTVDSLTASLARTRPPGSSRFIVRAIDGASPALLAPVIKQAGGAIRRTLPLINASVIELPHAALANLAASPLVARISLDRPIVGAMERSGSTIGATAIRENLGYDGTGVGIAMIDSGVTGWHDDLTASGGAQRVYHFVDFVNGAGAAYDDYGHGTHVAGIMAGNGFDSAGARSGIAPGAHLIVIKTLDASGRGRISHVIAALDYVVANKTAFDIRVVNLSLATGVYESYETDPLTLAAKRAVDAGIVVVAAAGNHGRSADGRDAYGGVTAPGNAPWVLTVGASSHMGTTDRADDVMAAFSSRGPSAVDYAAKPDIVAPAVGIESLSDPFSAFYTTKSQYLLSGTTPTWYLPYLSLSGTSLAAPLVSGTVALMLQANPALTPNQVKAILQYTAQVAASYDPLTEGAGFLNAAGAVELSQFFATQSTGVYPTSPDWSGRLIWGNQLVSGGQLTADANAWSTGVTWGAPTTPEGHHVRWGMICSAGPCDGTGGTWNPWTADGPSHNVVWGSACGGADCQSPWTVEAAAQDESVVWGTANAESVVWGTEMDESVVWGTICSDPACEPVIWPNP